MHSNFYEFDLKIYFCQDNDSGDKMPAMQGFVKLLHMTRRLQFSTLKHLIVCMKKKLSKGTHVIMLVM